MRRILVVAAVSVAGCFQPVGEPVKDAGVDAGHPDAGQLDAGMHFTDGGCDAPADCSGSRMSVNFCGLVGGAGWSCVDHACLWECNGSRTCEVTQTPDGGCIHCDTLGTECRDTFCTGGTTKSGSVESTTCPAVVTGNQVLVSGGDGCDFHMLLGQVDLGAFEQVGGGDFLASFPFLGGTCTGEILPTGAERWLFDCPTCEFVVRF